MSTFFSYAGLKASGTFPLDTTTATAIKADIKAILGKAVTLTGTTTPMVGYGSSGDPIQGIVTAIEKETVSGDSYVVTVNWADTFEDVETLSTGGATVNGGIAVNGSGAVIPATGLACGKCLAVDGTKCIIQLF